MRSTSSVRRIRVDGRDLIAKSATGAGRSHLRREAEICTCLAGAGVIEMVALRESDDRTDLVTELAGAHDLSGRAPLDPVTLRRALTTATTALEHLHERGWSHGAVCAEHVVVDRAGTATWCSLGSARPLDEATASEDLEQLRRVILEILGQPGPQWDAHDRARWRRWARSARRGIRDADDLGALRAALGTGTGTSIGAVAQSWRPGVPPGRTAAALAIAVLLVVGVATTTVRHRAAAATRDPILAAPADDPAPTTLDTDTDTSAGGCTAGADPAEGATHDIDGDGCPEVVEIHGNVVRTADTTFRVGDPGDDLLVGDWDCDGVATVLLLRPDSGEVFEFEWAERASPTTGRLQTVVDGATSLSSAPGPDGCDAASIERVGGPPVDPRLERPAPPVGAPGSGAHPPDHARPTDTTTPAHGGTP